MNIAGITSTTPPIKRGETGENSNITFYWSSNTTPDTYFYIGSIDGKTVSPLIKIGYMNTYRKVSVGDIIIYSEPNLTREFIVTLASESAAHIITVDVDTVGEYENQVESVSSQENDISISVNFTELPLSERYISNTLVPSRASTFGSYQYTSNNSDMTLLKVNVSSRNNKPFGNIKLTLEFYIDNISPAMDSIILNMFDYDYARQIYRNSIAGINRIAWTKTYRGYIGSYYRDPDSITNKMYPGIKLNNFDNEKLDNFVIVLKDFGQYNNYISLYKEETINANLLHQHCVTSIHFPGDINTKEVTYKDFYYKCYLFAYIPINSMTYTKKCIGEISLPYTSS